MVHNAESYKENLQHFEAANPENDTLIRRMSADDKDSYSRFVNRANAAYAKARKAGLPAWFKPYKDEVMKQNASRNTKNAPINFEALYALRTSFGETIWDMDISAQIGVPSGTLDNVRWDVKDYLLGSFEWPLLSKAFRQPQFMHLTESSQMNRGIGMYLGMSMSFTELAESGGGLWSPQAILQNQLAQKFGLTKSRRFFLGSSYYNARKDDNGLGSTLGITGVCNASGIQTVALGAGNDNVLDADSDIEYSLEVEMLPLLDKVYAPHRKVLLTSRGVLAESLNITHRDTYTGVTDFERICQKFFDTGILDSWIITDQLRVPATGTVPSITAEQDMYIICVGEGTVREDIVYPTQTLPMENKLYASDLAEVTIFGNIVYYQKADTTNNAFPAVTGTAGATTLGNGAYIRQGKVDIARLRGAMRSANA